MISMLALIGGITGMFVLFGVAWKILEPTPSAWQNEPTPTFNDEPLPSPEQVARNTIAYSVPPLPVVARPPVRRPPPLRPSEDDDDVKTHFFDRAMLGAVEAKLEPTEVLGEESGP